MYARVITVPTKPGVMDDVVSLYERSVIPVMEKQAGYKGFKLMGNEDVNVGISMTFWETEADMLAGEASGYLQEVLGGLAQFFAGPPSNAHYEVSLEG